MTDRKGGGPRHGFHAALLIRLAALAAVAGFLYEMWTAYDPARHRGAAGLASWAGLGAWAAVKWLVGYLSVQYLVLAFDSSWATRRIYGPLEPATRRLLASYTTGSRAEGVIRTGRSWSFYLGLFSAGTAWLFSSTQPLCFVGLSVAVQVWLHVRISRPPVVAFLGASSRANVERLWRIQQLARPLRVLSLLDVETSGSPDQALSLHLDTLRISGGDEWLNVVRRLLDVARIVVVDCAVATPPVAREVDYLLTSGLAYKCIFLPGPDGSSALLDEVGAEQERLCLLPHAAAEKLIQLMLASRDLPSETRPTFGRDELLPSVTNGSPSGRSSHQRA